MCIIKILLMVKLHVLHHMINENIVSAEKHVSL